MASAARLGASASVDRPWLPSTRLQMVDSGGPLKAVRPAKLALHRHRLAVDRFGFAPRTEVLQGKTELFQVLRRSVVFFSATRASPSSICRPTLRD